MKKILLMAMAAALMCGCDEGDMNVSGDGVKCVTFSVGGSGWGAVTRGLEADGTGMTDLWLFDYVDDELVGTLHKSQGDADFDSPSLGMAYGSHTVYFVASRGKTPTVNGTTIVWQQPSDTFWAVLNLDVIGSTANVAVTLDRVVTRFRVVVGDEVPDGMAKLCITPASWWYGLDYTTGAAIGEQQAERSITVPSSYIGTIGQLSVAIFGLSDDDEWMTDVTITAKDADDNSLGSVTLTDVPFMRNRSTEASGNLFAGQRGFSLLLNDEWLTSEVIDW